MPQNHMHTSLDFTIFKTFPGIFIWVQLLFCILSFIIAAIANYSPTGSPSRIFLLLMLSINIVINIVWLSIDVTDLKELKPFTNFNWNKVGILNSGINGFLILVAASTTVGNAAGSTTLKTAGVFGLLAFVVFLGQFCWEVSIYLQSGMPTSTATVVRGRNQAENNDSDVEEPLESGIQGSIKTRSLSLEPAEQQVASAKKKVGSDDDDFDSSDSDNSKSYNMSEIPQ